MRLTRTQQQAIVCGGRNLQLIACAGSGKTEVVAQRVAHMLTKRGKANLEPRNIVAFTFTNKAAAELKDRIIRRTREYAGEDLTGMAEMYVGTIHGFCQKLLQEEVPEYRKYEVLDAIRQMLYVNRNSTKTGLTTTSKLDGTQLRRLYKDTELYLSALAVLREDDLDTQKLGDCSAARGLDSYRRQLEQDCYFDFSELLKVAVEQLRDNPDLRARIGERIKYVVVDEYQDVNPIQEKLIRLLHDLGARVCVVGDDDQTIYQWRGSSASHILDFRTRYPGVSQVKLEENFRSSQGIIETAERFIAKVDPEHRLRKEMRYGGIQQYEPGDIVALSTFGSPEDEAQYIADTIKSLHGVSFTDDDGERGLSWRDMAILLRSVKNDGAVITETLQDGGVPFVVTGLTDLFETNEARAVRDLFYFIAGERFYGQSISEQSLLQSWQRADLGLSQSGLDEAIRYAGQHHEWLEANEQGVTPQQTFLAFLARAGFREENVPDGRREVVLCNLGRVSQAIHDWESINFNSNRKDLFQGFAGFLRYQGEDAYSSGADEDIGVFPDAVQVMTVHQAKGRQWPAVFLPALRRRRFPSTPRDNSIWDLIPQAAVQNAERYNGSTDDERRLFYVAITRSQKFLHMTCSIDGNLRPSDSVSEFLTDILASKWVKKQLGTDYASRKRVTPQPQTAVADVDFTVTDLKHLYECQYKFKLTSLYGFNGAIHPATGYGESLHNALAEVHRRAMNGSPISEADISELVKSQLRLPYAPRGLRDRLEEKARKDIANYIRDNVENLERCSLLEQDVEIPLTEGVVVKGRIDVVRRRDSSEVTIVDLKSYDSSHREDSTQIQLGAYARGYRQLTGEDAHFVEVYDVGKGRHSRRAVDESLMGEVDQRLAEAAESLRERRFHPSPTKQKCERCDVSGICSASLDPKH